MGRVSMTDATKQDSCFIFFHRDVVLYRGMSIYHDISQNDTSVGLTP